MTKALNANKEGTISMHQVHRDRCLHRERERERERESMIEISPDKLNSLGCAKLGHFN